DRAAGERARAGAGPLHLHTLPRALRKGRGSRAGGVPARAAGLGPTRPDPSHRRACMTRGAPPYRPDPEVVFTPVSDAEAILLSLTTKRYYSLNETGLRIWRWLEEEPSTDPLEALVRDYDVTPEQAQ